MDTSSAPDIRRRPHQALWRLARSDLVERFLGFKSRNDPNTPNRSYRALAG